MKQLFISLGIVIIYSSVLSGTPTSEQYNALQAARTFFQSCKASKSLTTHQYSYERICRLSAWYDRHKEQFAQMTSLSEQAAEQLCNAAAQELARTAQHYRPTRSPELLDLVDSLLHESGASVLEKLLNRYNTEYSDDIVPYTTNKQLLSRIGMKIVIEIVYALYKDTMQSVHTAPPRRYPETPPTLSTRIQTFPRVFVEKIQDRTTQLNMLGAVAKVGGYFIADELIPHAQATQDQKLAELLMPVICGQSLGWMLTGKREDKKVGKFLVSLLFALVTRTIMVRGYFNQKHAAYKPLDIAAKALPFLRDTAGKQYILRGNITGGSVANALLDGLLIIANYNGIAPQIKRALPENHHLNRQARRKVIGNALRDALGKLLENVAVAQYTQSG